jgi:hypothetical protein
MFLFDPIPFKFSNYNFIINSLLKNSKHNFFDFLNNKLETYLNMFYLNNKIKNNYLNDFIFNKYGSNVKYSNKSLKFYDYVNKFLTIAELSINFKSYESKIYKILNNFDTKYSNNSYYNFNYKFLKIKNLMFKNYIKNSSIFLKNNTYIVNNWGYFSSIGMYGGNINFKS